MPHETAQRIGVCSWSLQPDGPQSLVEDLKAIAITKLQLALDPIREAPEVWSPLADLLGEAGIQLVSAQFGALGEDYTNPQTIRHTGGFVPTSHWQDNLRNVRTNLDLAKAMGITVFTTHAGFIPPDTHDPVFEILVGRLRTLADLIRDACDGDLLLETGQEKASTLNRFLQRVGRPNLGVNFDPANMLLYDMGDPLAAVRELLPHIGQVHIKDAAPPIQPGAWGEEVVMGRGQVDWKPFLNTLTAGGYQGDWIIEREAGTQRRADIAAARESILATLP